MSDAPDYEVTDEMIDTFFRKWTDVNTRAALRAALAVSPLVARVKELEEENFALAAQSCVHLTDGTGLKMDDYGNTFCAKAKRIAELEAKNERLRSVLKGCVVVEKPSVSPRTQEWSKMALDAALSELKNWKP
jgi:hypothetical protein